MNEKVKEFIDKMKEAEKVEKEELLITLGLAEPAVVRKYSANRDFIYDKYDDEKKLYYVDVESLVPIEVTDEEYSEILKYVPMFKARIGNAQTKEAESSIAKVISVMVNIITIICIFGGLLLFNVVDYNLRWLPICVLVSGIIYYPFLKGFAKIVAAAEKSLKEK